MLSCLVLYFSIPSLCFPITFSVPCWSLRGHTVGLSSLPSLRAVQPDNPAACCPPGAPGCHSRSKRSDAVEWNGRWEEICLPIWSETDLRMELAASIRTGVYIWFVQGDPAVWAEVTVLNVWAVTILSLEARHWNSSHCFHWAAATPVCIGTKQTERESKRESERERDTWHIQPYACTVNCMVFRPCSSFFSIALL